MSEDIAEGLALGVIPGQHGVIVAAQVVTFEFGAVGATDMFIAPIGVGVDGRVEDGDFARGEKAFDDREGLKVEKIFLAIVRGGEGHLFDYDIFLWVRRSPRRYRRLRCL